MIFLSPMLLFGMFLASVPILIHLLNRRRFRIVDWAPMKYLKLTIKKNRRRMRIEQLILLAVRTLAVLALFAALARPVLSATGLGSWLGARGRSAKFIVIDDSLSMGYRDVQTRRSAFDAAKEAATQLVKTVSPQDSVTVLTTSSPDAPLLKDAHLDDPSKAIAAIAKLEPTDARGDWPAIFKVIDQHLAAAPFPAKDLVLITDLRREGWGADVSATAKRWASDSVEAKLIDVGSRQTANVSLVGFDLQDPVALPGQQASLMATVRNDQTTPVTGAQAVLSVGGESRPILLPDLAPGSTTRVPITQTLQQPGQYPLLLKLPGDALSADDSRWLNLNVRPNLQVTLVDGEPGARPFESETDFLALAFSVGSVPWHTNHQTDAEWAISRTGEQDVIVLANVATVSDERVKALEQLVRDGTGLMIFAGDQVDASNYNERLFKDRAGLLPARLDKVSEEPVTGLVVESLEDSPLAPLAKIAPAALGRVVAKKFMIAESPATKSPQVRVLARWNDSEAHPAVIEKKFGRGRVLLFTVTADRQWSDWPIERTYVLAVRSAALAVARPDGKENEVDAGEPIRHRVPAGEQVADARVISPGATEPEVATVEKTSARISIAHAKTSHAGPYTLKWKDGTGAERTQTVVANPDKRESDLRPIVESELADLLSPLDVPVIHYTGGETSLTGQGREIWKTLATALLLLVAVETVLAVWVGRER
jgi:hypothetical protein